MLPYLAVLNSQAIEKALHNKHTISQPLLRINKTPSKKQTFGCSDKKSIKRDKEYSLPKISRRVNNPKANKRNIKLLNNCADEFRVTESQLFLKFLYSKNKNNLGNHPPKK